MANFNIAVQNLLKREGGLNTNPNDRGGTTKYGISQKAYPNENIPALTVERAKALYLRDFWAPSGLDYVNSQDTAEAVFDTMVNSGLTGGGKLVQKALIGSGISLVVDGKLGSKSIQGLNSVPPRTFLENLSTERKKFVVSLAERDPRQESFIKGWFKRFDSFLASYKGEDVGTPTNIIGVLVFGFLVYQLYSKA